MIQKRYVWTRIFFENREKNRLKTKTDMCGRGLDIVFCYRDLVPSGDRLGGGGGGGGSTQ